MVGRRLSSALLVALVLGMAATPLLAITCVPGHSCPMAGMAARGFGARAAGPTVAAADCCLRSERRPAPGAVQRPLVPHLDAVTAYVAMAVVEPPRFDPARELARVSRPPRAVPLYTLHSLLLL